MRFAGDEAMWIWILQVARDLRHACRTIAGMPGLAAVIVASLGVGIGVNTAVFSWLQALVLQPIPGVRDTSRLQLVEPRAETGSYPGVSWTEYRELRERLPSFRDLLVSRMVAFNVGEAGRLERTFGLLVSDNYFSALGLQPALGRFMQPAEQDAAVRTGVEPIVISHEFWKTRFGGARDAVGRTLRVNERPLTIVGVAPRDFHGTVTGVNFDLWVPATLAPVVLVGSRELEERRARGYSAMGTLQAHATRAQAQSDLDAAMWQLAHDFPDTNGKMGGEVLPLWKAPRGPQRFLVAALGALQVVMLLLLVTVCGNAAALVLARAGTRQREIGVRMALGAGRWRVFSLLLTENLLLGLASAALGAAIAVWGTEALRAVRISLAFPIEFHTRIDAAGLAVATLLGVGCGLVFGVGPAVQLARVDPQSALRNGGSTSRRSRMREALMGVQVALALLVLIVAAISLKSFQEARHTYPGFRPEGVLLAAYEFTGRNVPSQVSRDFVSRLLERLRALPSVEAAAVAASVPLDIHGLPLRSFALEGRARADGAPDRALTNTVTPGYFRTMGIPLREGTDFAELSDPAAPLQMIVNEAFVRRYVAGGDAVRPRIEAARRSAASPQAIGRRIDAAGRRYTIVGVCENSLYESFGESPTPAVYFSYRDNPLPLGEIHLRTRAGAESALASELRRVVRGLEPALPLYNLRTMSEHIDTNLVFRRIPARMFLVLGPLLLALAAIGIYATVGYTVSHRTAEIGVRLALGATAGRLVVQIVGNSLGVIGVGALAGWVTAFVVALDVVPGGSIDVPVFAGVPAALLLVASFACWLPVHRAMAADPMAALRRE